MSTAGWRWPQWMRVWLAAWILTGGAFFVVVRPLWAAASGGWQPVTFEATPQAAINERVQTLARDVAELRSLNLDARLRLVEDTVVEVKWLGRTIVAVLLGQLLIGLRISRNGSTP